VRAAADPAADDMVAFGYKIGRAAEGEVGKGPAKAGHEIPHVVMATTRSMQRILQEHVGCGELLDHLGVPGIAPEFREPAADQRLVFLFLGHGKIPSCWWRYARGDVRHQRSGKYPPAAAN
jgi:hypothetical protein